MTPFPQVPVTPSPHPRVPGFALVSAALLVLPLMYWVAIALYLAGSRALSGVLLDRVPAAWEIAFMLGAPLLAAMVGARNWWCADTVRARVIGQLVVVVGILFAAMAILASLRPS